MHRVSLQLYIRFNMIQLHQERFGIILLNSKRAVGKGYYFFSSGKLCATYSLLIYEN